MGASKADSPMGVCIFVVMTLSTMAGVALTMTSLLIENWVEVEFTEGIVHVRGKVGLWSEEICDNKGCTVHWKTDDDYVGHPKVTFTSREEIRIIETTGVGLAVVGLLALIPMWATRRRSRSAQTVAQAVFFIPCFFSCILCMIGAFMVMHIIDFAPILSVVGSACMFAPAAASCAYHRYNPKYKTKDEMGVVMDEARFDQIRL